MNSAHIQVRAPAKINLVLRVLGRRPDDFHNVWSLMQTVDLADELHLTVTHDSTTIQLRCDEAALPADRTNLVYRAASLALERADRPVGVAIDLRKRIPMGAGLGGGEQ